MTETKVKKLEGTPGRSAMEDFVGEDAARSLDDALDGLLNDAPVFAWADGLRLEDDISSKELLARCPGFKAPTAKYASDRAFTTFIKGKLEISGQLRVI